jgi:glycosyltransferase involved in cell wall biosynthesis
MSPSSTGRSSATSRPTRVALVLPYYDPRAGEDPLAVLERFPTIPGIAAAEAERGMEVAAFQLFPRRADVAMDGAAFHFVPSPPPLRRAARLLHRALPRYRPPYWEPAAPLVHQVAAWQPDVVHAFGATLDLNLALTAASARRSDTGLVVHYHGGGPEADPVTQALRRRTLGGADRLLFTHRAQADPWIAAGMVRPAQVAEVVETSTHIRPEPRARAIALSRMRGEPACLMVGRLHPIKDPLTVLAGFAIVAERRPLAMLHIVGPDEGLEQACRAIVAATPSLVGRVHFHGAQPAESMPAYYGAADLLLQASRREWSGLSVLEAMACGVVPVLSDIPPFRAMTQEGRYGRLFPVGDAGALARAGLALRPRIARPLGYEVRAHFDARLSFAAIAGRLEDIYGEVLEERAWQRGRGTGGRRAR